MTASFPVFFHIVYSIISRPLKGQHPYLSLSVRAGYFSWSGAPLTLYLPLVGLQESHHPRLSLSVRTGLFCPIFTCSSPVWYTTSFLSYHWCHHLFQFPIGLYVLSPVLYFLSTSVPHYQHQSLYPEDGSSMDSEMLVSHRITKLYYDQKTTT